MKAITVTTELKNANNQLFLNNNINSIKTFGNIPKSFVSLNYNNGQRTDGYHTLDNSLHESDGFYNVTIPAYDDATQKLGIIFFDVDEFTYTVIPKTQQEQDDFTQQEEDNDQYGQVTSTRRIDGDKMIERFFAFITREFGEGNISGANSLLSANLIWDAIAPLAYGQMEVAKNRLNTIDQTGLHQDVVDNIDLAINRVQNYIDNE